MLSSRSKMHLKRIISQISLFVLAMIMVACSATLLGETPTDLAATFTPQPTYTLIPTYTPQPTYTQIPTFTPNVVIATRAPIILTATPNADEQDPPPGSIINAGESYRRKNIVITLSDSIETSHCVDTPTIRISFNVENRTGREVVLRWRNSFFHLRDDKGNVYPQRGESSSSFDGDRQRALKSSEVRRMFNHCTSGVGQSFNEFEGVIDPSAQYLIITLDQLAGMSEMSWRYDLLP